MSDFAKQVIVVRTDLNMPVGKIASQVAHASMAVLLNRMNILPTSPSTNITVRVLSLKGDDEFDAAINDWIEGSFTKVVVGVGSEEELRALYDKATELGLPCSQIIDNGRTVFNGVQTLTCCAFGPVNSSVFTGFTSHLKLLR